MKKTLFSNFLLLFIVSTFYLSNTFAEDTTHWNLPENAKARLGKGEIREMQYSSDGQFSLLRLVSVFGSTTQQHIKRSRFLQHIRRQSSALPLVLMAKSSPVVVMTIRYDYGVLILARLR